MIKFVSYNIPHLYNKNNQNTEEFKIFSKEITKIDPDFILLQECEKCNLDNYITVKKRKKDDSMILYKKCNYIKFMKKIKYYYWGGKEKGVKLPLESWKIGAEFEVYEKPVKILSVHLSASEHGREARKKDLLGFISMEGSIICAGDMNMWGGYVKDELDTNGIKNIFYDKFNDCWIENGMDKNNKFTFYGARKNYLSRYDRAFITKDMKTVSFKLCFKEYHESTEMISLSDHYGIEFCVNFI